MARSWIDTSARRPRRAPAAVALLGGLLWLACTTLAMAHASLVGSEPDDGAIVDRAPATFSLSFSEAVSPLLIRLVAPDGGQTTLENPTLRDRTIEIAAPADLARGTHVLSWRVVSGDGHPVAGSVVFSVGEKSVGTPPVPDTYDVEVRGALWLGKAALYVGLFLGIGGAFASAWLGTAASGRRFVRASLVVGLAGAAVSLAAQGLDALGLPLGSVLEPLAWQTGMNTSFGLTAVIALLALIMALVVLSLRGRAASVISLIALLAAGAALASSGHASAAEPQWMMRPAVFLHAVTIAFWTGALVPLAVALRRDSAEAMPALARFSNTIPYAVALLILAGVVLAVVQVEEPRALLDTAYGRVLLAKLALLAVLFGLALLNRARLTRPAIDGAGAARRMLAATIIAEVLLVLTVFGVASFWRFTPPPRALAIAAKQPATAYIHTDRALSFIQVMPGRTGTVDIAVNLLTGEFQALNAKEVAVILANPAAGIEPFRRSAVRNGDANWRVEKVDLPLPGAWSVQVEILISDFEMLRLDGQLNIRP